MWFTVVDRPARLQTRFKEIVIGEPISGLHYLLTKQCLGTTFIR